MPRYLRDLLLALLVVGGTGITSARVGTLSSQAAGPLTLAQVPYCAGVSQGTVHAVAGAGAAFFVQPPGGFNPLTATDAQLACYGFPKRPESSTGLAQWEDVMAHAKTYVAPALWPAGTLQPPAAGTVCSGCSYYTWYGGGNYPWSGYAIAASNNNWSGLQWTQVNGEWAVPYGNPNKGCHNSNNTNAAIVAPWVGLGGDGWDHGTGTKLIQAGTDTYDTNRPPPYTPVITTFWYENYNADPTQVLVSTPAVKQGDRVYVNVQYSRGYATYFYENYTTNYYNSVSESASNPDLSSAEAIAESFPWNQNYMNYRSIEFFSPEAYGTWGNNYNISKLLSDNVTLSQFTAYSDSTEQHQTSVPGSIDVSGDFTDSATAFDTC